MATESIAHVLHKLACTADQISGKIKNPCVEKMDGTNRETIISNTMIFRILCEIRERAWNGKFSLTYDPCDDTRYEKGVATIKDLAVKELEALGFVVMVECSHSVYDSRENKRTNFIKCDMSIIRCDPRIHVSW